MYDRILITGGNGMLAYAFKQSLGRRGIDYTALTRDQLDIADTEAVLDVFGQYDPTLVINCAAYTKVDQAEQEPELAERVNGRGPFVLGKGRVPVVHFSTDFVFDGNAREPYPADHPTAPLSAYGRSKLSGERQLLKRSPDSLV
ncbi:MAG TPA: sugar nucleotide-binding protein, partial [Tepidisphaeraceae bacterium]|nr:sugar nucleotide-binding protein [Tepidisphaeraceae bacterium]